MQLTEFYPSDRTRLQRKIIHGYSHGLVGNMPIACHTCTDTEELRRRGNPLFFKK